ncbi:DUF4097 family beta strand repeat-containing protein [Tautonia marina]|uniref:DUF4097 family beta strand repeat-containing protein n=1 Tax=Tautonia marina TaxID=2653855 RepID=UPI0012609F79|nr:DUF4097 family beta strand repeat-containing protein [Tautonia marina]
MARSPENLRDGIRFLDETPEPVEPTPPQASGGKRKKKEWPVGLIAFLAVVTGGIVWKMAQDDEIAVREVYEERFEVDDAPRIEVDAIQGSVRVRRGSDGMVVCRVETEGRGMTPGEAGRSLGILKPVMRSTGDGVSIRIGGMESRGPISGGVAIRLEVPADAQVRVMTDQGSIRVSKVRGSIAARSGLGKIEVEGASGPLVLDSKNGSIEVEAEQSLVLASTSNGSIEFEGSLAEGTSRFRTSNGSVSLELPENQALIVDAKAGNGRVSSDFPIGRVRSESGVIPVGFDPQALGIAGVEIRTGNGSIRVEKEED